LEPANRLLFKALEQVYYSQTEVSSSEQEGRCPEMSEMSMVLVNGFYTAPSGAWPFDLLYSRPGVKVNLHQAPYKEAPPYMGLGVPPSLAAHQVSLSAFSDGHLCASRQARPDTPASL
jgi:hypothetical protein